MEELYKFDLEYLQGDIFSQSEDILIPFEEISNSQDYNSLNDNLRIEGNTMNDFPSVWELDTTATVKRKWQASSEFDKIKTEISLTACSTEHPFNLNEDYCPFYLNELDKKSCT